MEMKDSPHGWNGLCFSGLYNRDRIMPLIMGIDQSYVYLIHNKNSISYVGEGGPRKNINILRFDEHKRNNLISGETKITIFFERDLLKNKIIRKFIESKLFFYLNNIYELKNKQACLVKDLPSLRCYMLFRNEIDKFCKGMLHILKKDIFTGSERNKFNLLQKEQMLFQLRIDANANPRYYAKANADKNSFIVRKGSYALHQDENSSLNEKDNNLRNFLEGNNTIIYDSKSKLFKFDKDHKFSNPYQATAIIVGKYRPSWEKAWTKVTEGWPIWLYEIEFKHSTQYGRMLNKKFMPIF